MRPASWCSVRRCPGRPGHRSAGPWLVMVPGAAAAAPGAFYRDHMVLTGPGFTAEPWYGQAHDVVSSIADAAMAATPAVRCRSAWQGRGG